MIIEKLKEWIKEEDNTRLRKQIKVLKQIIKDERNGSREEVKNNEIRRD